MEQLLKKEQAPVGADRARGMSGKYETAMESTNRHSIDSTPHPNSAFDQPLKHTKVKLIITFWMAGGRRRTRFY